MANGVLEVEGCDVDAADSAALAVVAGDATCLDSDGSTARSALDAHAPRTINVRIHNHRATNTVCPVGTHSGGTPPNLLRMDQPRRFDVARLWVDYGARLMRYGGVTIVSTVVGLSSLAVGLYVFEWPPLFANFISVCMSTPPAYYLNRQWVWGRKPGNHKLAGEIGPFWVMTFLGFAVSMTAIAAVGTVTKEPIVILLTQVASFGALWLVKFAFLEKYLWHDGEVRVSQNV